MLATARMASISSSTPPGRSRLVRDVGPRERMSALKISFISACCLLAGAACLFAFVAGPLPIENPIFYAVLAPVVVALLGWFYLIPIFVFVGIVWKLYGSHWASWRQRVVLMICCAILGSAFMLIFGFKGPVFTDGAGGTEPGFVWGYGVGGFIGGALGAYLVTILKREMAQPGVAPNGGPATPVGNSEVTEGPPSVS